VLRVALLRRCWILFLGIPLFAAGIVPDRYIVELSGESVAQYIGRTVTPSQRRAALLGETGRRYRATVRAAQAAARTRLERRGAVVMGSVDTVANALFIRVPAAGAARLAQSARQSPGVRRVLPVSRFRLVLDHALPLHKIPEAWSLGGAYPQGAGMRIAMIDTGIEITHPGFNDAGFQAPPGFPKVNAASDTAYTNQKVIVARSYASLFEQVDPDPSARDDVGHGTGTAMTAAGVQNTGPLTTITGAAPLAYLGNYKVFGSLGVNDGATEDSILKAIDDAVADGMDVINLSLGTPIAPRPADDPEVQALETAVSSGVIVVAAAGNSGPDRNTMSSPATGPSVIAAGASNNDRAFYTSVKVSGGGPYPTVPAAEALPANPITAPLVAAAKLDPTGLACVTLPAKSLTGSIALILRGTCDFSVKLNGAQQAGAVAALVYSEQSSPDAVTMDVGTATLPAEMVSYQDGLAIKQLAAQPVQATLDFTQYEPFAVDPNSIATFSGRGPNADLAIKPDLLAVGDNIYTAAENVDPLGELYSADGYENVAGTSFSAPLVSGAAAVLEAARPGFTALQYRSLLINSAAPAFLPPGQPQHVQDAGAGVLDLSAAVRSTLSAAPSSISFGAGTGDAQLSASLRLSNIGYNPDNFLISVLPAANSPAPVPSTTSVQLGSNTYFDVGLTFTASGLAAGEYEGFIVIQGTSSGIETRVPYWYAVASLTPAVIAVLSTPDSPPAAGSTVTDAIDFRVTDASGIIVGSVQPTVTVTSGGGAVVRITSEDDAYPGVWSVDIRMGPTSGGSNVFHIVAGGISQDVTITAQ
jgi:minor extracellular serine protease Vpr